MNDKKAGLSLHFCELDYLATQPRISITGVGYEVNSLPFCICEGNYVVSPLRGG